jgi:hypothetical protein
VAIRAVWVADPEGKLRLDAFVCPDLAATPVELLPWVVRRWALAVPFEDARAHRGVATQRPWSDHASARTTPVLLGLCSVVTLLALQLSQGGPIPGPATAWSHTVDPTFADGLALVRQHRWRARS